MTSESTRARWAGLAYLVVVVTGTFSMGYVPGQLAAPGSLQTVLANIISHKWLFSAGIASFMLEQVAFLLLPLLLFRLLNTVHRSVAVVMVALAITAVPIALVGVGHRLDALWLLTDNGGLSVETARAMASFSLKSYSHAIFVASMFWGLWLLPFGYLVIKSGMLSRLLGVLLILGGVGYLVDVFAELLLPEYADMSLSNYIPLPAALAEMGTCLWLLVMGVRRRGASESVGQLRSAI
ncbi:MAG: DUF4386 domain-containing protein [Rhodanobacter sp.]